MPPRFLQVHACVNFSDVMCSSVTHFSRSIFSAICMRLSIPPGTYPPEYRTLIRSRALASFLQSSAPPRPTQSRAQRGNATLVCSSILTRHASPYAGELYFRPGAASLVEVRAAVAEACQAGHLPRAMPLPDDRVPLGGGITLCPPVSPPLAGDALDRLLHVVWKKQLERRHEATSGTVAEIRGRTRHQIRRVHVM